jgi:hypothetical protein
MKVADGLRRVEEREASVELKAIGGARYSRFYRYHIGFRHDQVIRQTTGAFLLFALPSSSFRIARMLR